MKEPERHCLVAAEALAKEGMHPGAIHAIAAHNDDGLAHTGIALRYPAQKTFLVDGAPRDSLRPDLLVDLAAPLGGAGDPILYQALKLLEK